MSKTVPWGSGASQLQIRRAVEQYFRENPPAPGTATDGQVSAAVTDYMQRNPAPGGKGGLNTTDAQVAAAVAAYLTANPSARGMALLRQIVVTDTALLALGLGLVELQFACVGAVVGERYEAYIRSYKLNGAATATQGRPPGYWINSADCRVADTITVAHMRPALSLGGKYELFTDIMKVNAP